MNRVQPSGFALASVLLALLLLSALALVASLAARAQTNAAGVAVRIAAAETAARGAIEAQLGRMNGVPPRAAGSFRPQLGTGVLGGLPWSVADYRVDDEFHVLIGSAPIEATESRARDARLVWWMDPDRRVAGHRAVIESLELTLAPDALISAEEPLGEHGEHPSCAHRASLAAAFPGPVRAHGTLPGAPEWGGDTHLFGGLRLGWYGSEALVDLADHRVGGSVTLDECPTCWMGVVAASSPTVLGGSGAGVLIAQSDLALEPGTHWSGLVLVAGNLQLSAGATVVGLVRSGGAVTLADSASVTASACAAYRSLEAAHSLLRPLRIPGPSRIGPMPHQLD
ncbi:MAG: hypothetical protein ACR2QM_04235 [Longimicrobiales bacterium]